MHAILSLFAGSVSFPTKVDVTFAHSPVTLTPS